MKLELKHLAPYLPYGLRMQVLKNYCNGGGFWTLAGNETEMESKYIESQMTHCKPILRPLSDYVDINSMAMNILNVDISTQIELTDFALNEKSLNTVSYELYEVMCWNHIDFNSLIDQNLAIDINTITNG